MFTYLALSQSLSFVCPLTIKQRDVKLIELIHLRDLKWKDQYDMHYSKLTLDLMLKSCLFFKQTAERYGNRLLFTLYQECTIILNISVRAIKSMLMYVVLLGQIKACFMCINGLYYNKEGFILFMISKGLQFSFYLITTEKRKQRILIYLK